jgi:tRNA 5-methylaminomethyl-2-thiouridine biosynthesis bifunctional protein
LRALDPDRGAFARDGSAGAGSAGAGLGAVAPAIGCGDRRAVIHAMSSRASTIVPAQLTWRDGVPFSEHYRDVYASRDGALGQARHVFLGGNDLPARWQGRGQFVILETGFGLGINFLATLQAWRADPQRSRRLHFVSVELHPVSAAALVEAAPEELRPLAQQLAAQWPLPLAGLHRLLFEDGAVALTLAFGDARALLPQLALGADAIYLDGFSPQRNPGLWEAPLLKAVGRLARPGATLASYTAARAVRDALSACGFDVALRPGYARKRHMLAARFAPRWRVRRHEPPPAYEGERQAVVIGAGLAGAHAADALARRGWRVVVLDSAAQAATGASALPWGLLHPQVSADDSLAARLSRAGFLWGRQRLAALAPGGDDTLWRPSGVAQIAGSEADAAAWQAFAEQAPWPPAYAAFASRDWLAARLALAPRRGGWWFEQGAVVSARAWCRALLAQPGIDLRLQARVARIARAGDGGQWQAQGADGRVLAAAPVLVVASALEAPRLLGDAWLPAQAVRGRISYVDAPALARLAAGLTGDGYLVSAPDGSIGVGASYELTLPGAAGPGEVDAQRVHAGNLQRLVRLLAEPVPARVTGVFDGLRCVAPDRLPYAGAVADVGTCAAAASVLRGAHLADLPRAAGLHASCALGSRGLTLAPLLGELIAAQVEGEPWPVERDLAAAVDPARRLLSALRHGRMAARER